MAKKKGYSLRSIPPCPNPEKYILVKTRYGNLWRRKRGSITKAVLNSSLAGNSELSKITMPAASRILARLKPFTHSFSMNFVNMTISARLKKFSPLTGKIKFSALEGMDIQEEYPLHRILLCDYKVQEDSGEIKLTIALNKGEVQPQNNLATDYYFELVLLYGNADKEKGLQVRSVESPLYSFSKKIKKACELELPLPPAKKQWMLLLKISCMEGNEPGKHAKHYAMKVVKTGAMAT